MFRRLEQALGLPDLDKVLPLVQGESGKRVERLLARVERLSKDSAGLGQAVELLKLVERLDKEGTLQRLDELLKDLAPLMKSKTAHEMVARLGQLGDLLGGPKAE